MDGIAISKILSFSRVGVTYRVPFQETSVESEVGPRSPGSREHGEKDRDPSEIN